nr:MAG TPA: hypothetical protein [Caudoviricetes sp.]
MQGLSLTPYTHILRTKFILNVCLKKILIKCKKSIRKSTIALNESYYLSYASLWLTHDICFTPNYSIS